MEDLKWVHNLGYLDLSFLKGYFCHHLLTLKLLQTCMSIFLQMNTNEYILKNDWNQTTVVWHHLPPY